MHQAVIGGTESAEVGRACLFTHQTAGPCNPHIITRTSFVYTWNVSVLHFYL